MELCGKVGFMRHAAGTLLYKEGQAGDCLYMVIKGSVGIWQQTTPMTPVSHASTSPTGEPDGGTAPGSAPETEPEAGTEVGAAAGAGTGAAGAGVGAAADAAKTARGKLGTQALRLTAEQAAKLGVRIAVVRQGGTFGELSVERRTTRLNTAIVETTQLSASELEDTAADLLYIPGEGPSL